jgi:GR25 family glycosyltransferase involved in LPS biosynthesis
MLKKIIKILSIVILGVIVALFIKYPGFYVLNKTQQKIKQSDAQIKGSVGIYIINLERSKERRKHILDQVEKLNMPYEIVLAVDGNTLSDNDINKLVDFNSYEIYKNNNRFKGEIGCSLSNFKVLRKFLESNYEYALVLEDDISFDPEVLREIIKKVIKMNDLWNIVSFELSHRGMPITMQNISPTHHLVYYLFDLVDSGAYLIDREAASKLLQYSAPIQLPYDRFYTRMWEFDIKFAGVEPRLVKQPFLGSEIEDGKFVTKAAKKPHSISRIIFKIKTEAIRFVYNMKLIIAKKLKT